MLADSSFLSELPAWAQAGIAFIVLLVVVYAAFQVIFRLRPSTSISDTSGDNLVQNFEEMQLEGDIDEEELRKIKSVLGKTQDKR